MLVMDEQLDVAENVQGSIVCYTFIQHGSFSRIVIREGY